MMYPRPTEAAASARACAATHAWRQPAVISAPQLRRIYVLLQHMPAGARDTGNRAEPLLPCHVLDVLEDTMLDATNGCTVTEIVEERMHDLSPVPNNLRWNVLQVGCVPFS